MHPDLRALLESVKANPADDLPRLVMAGWLEEHEESVVCVKCNGKGFHLWGHISQGFPPRERRGCEACSGTETCYGTGRVSNGFAKHARFIREQLAAGISRYSTFHPEDYQRKTIGVCCDWHRGFIRDVQCNMAGWLRHGPAICDLHPVQLAVITDKKPHRTRNGWTYYGIDGGGFDPTHVPVCIQSEPRFPMYFQTVADANADLSDKCISWAKSQPVPEEVNSGH